MARMNENWKNTDRLDGVQEYFWLGKFIQSDQWLGPPKFEPDVYPYRKSGFEYRGNIYTFDNEISVTEITHATKFERANSILRDGGFRSQEKYYPGIGDTSLVWFGLKIGKEQIDRVKENSESSVYALFNFEDKQEAKVVISRSQFIHTPAFQPTSRYGHCKFTFGIRDVLEAYRTQFCDTLRGPLEMRRLGTFAYERETMHVILVCSRNTPGTDKCPTLSDDDPVMKPDARFETWTWKPHSTGSEYVSFPQNDKPYSESIRWEHVVFAFSVPKNCLMKIDNLENRLSFCLHLSEKDKVSGFTEYIDKLLDWIPSSGDKKISMANMLIRMIAGYLNEEPLYKKTMAEYIYKDHKDVDFETVVQRLQKILESQFLHVNWRPLRIWMDSLTTHSNVLHVKWKASSGN